MPLITPFGWYSMLCSSSSIAHFISWPVASGWSRICLSKGLVRIFIEWAWKYGWRRQIATTRANSTISIIVYLILGPCRVMVGSWGGTWARQMPTHIVGNHISMELPWFDTKGAFLWVKLQGYCSYCFSHLSEVLREETYAPTLDHYVVKVYCYILADLSFKDLIGQPLVCDIHVCKAKGYFLVGKDSSIGEKPSLGQHFNPSSLGGILCIDQVSWELWIEDYLDFLIDGWETIEVLEAMLIEVGVVHIHSPPSF